MSQSLTPRSDAAWSRLVALRESGYMGRVDQDGYPVTDDVPVDVPTQYPARPWVRAMRVCLVLMVLALLGVLHAQRTHDFVLLVGFALGALGGLFGAVAFGMRADSIDSDHLVGVDVDDPR